MSLRSAAPAGVTAGRADISRLVSADPAANAEATYTLLKPATLLAVTLQIVQGATQTPQPILLVTDASDNVVYRSLGSSAAMTASTTANFIWGVGLALSALVGTTPDIYAQAPLAAGLTLPTGYKVKTTTLGKGAATDLGVLGIFVAEFT